APAPEIHEQQRQKTRRAADGASRGRRLATGELEHAGDGPVVERRLLEERHVVQRRDDRGSEPHFAADLGFARLVGRPRLAADAEEADDEEHTEHERRRANAHADALQAPLRAGVRLTSAAGASASWATRDPTRAPTR